MSWFQKASYPEYWHKYANRFREKETQNINELRFVVFDTETTGLDPRKDRILSIGCIGIRDLKIRVSDQFESYVFQETFDKSTVKIHGLLKTGKEHKMSEEEALSAFLNYIENAVLVAHHAAFDLSMINGALKRMNLPRLKNKIVDTGHLYTQFKRNAHTKHFSLDDLSKEMNIPQHDRHTASGDAYITALLFLKLIAKMSLHKKLYFNDLLMQKPKIGLL